MVQNNLKGAHMSKLKVCPRGREVEVEGVKFPTPYTADLGKEFAEKGCPALVAVAADYGFYWIPFSMYNLITSELERCGRKYRIYFRGPRRGPWATVTKPEQAVAFTIYFGEKRKER